MKIVRGLGILGALCASALPSFGQLFVSDPSQLLAHYHADGVMPWDSAWTWNGQPVSDTNKPSDSQMRLAADIKLYSDTTTLGRLFIEVSGVVTLQGVSTFGAAYDASVLTGLRFGTAADPTGFVSSFYLSGETEKGGTSSSDTYATPLTSTPGFGLLTSGPGFTIQTTSGAQHGFVSYGSVWGTVAISGGGVFALDYGPGGLPAFDYRNLAIDGRFGVDRTFVRAAYVEPPVVPPNGAVPEPGATGLAAALVAFGLLVARRAVKVRRSHGRVRIGLARRAWDCGG